MKIYFKFIIIAVIFLAGEFTVFAAIKNIPSKQFIYGAWLPYWKKTEAIKEISPNLGKFGEISPFSYDVNEKGELIDRLKMNTDIWQDFLGKARGKKLKIIPTIAWFNPDEIHFILSDKTSRNAHIKNIVSLVKENNFDGIDIDYENKDSETRIYFSAFLRDLSRALKPGKKFLSCSIEARTPLSSRFKNIPDGIEYANDYKAINAYCDEVRVLAYDQGRIDLVLNKIKGQDFYFPVADKIWTEKVIKEALKNISSKKLMLAVPTFGYEYSVKKDGNKISYEKTRSLTYKKLTDLAASLNLSTKRNSANELSLVYATSVPAENLIASSTAVLISASAAPTNLNNDSLNLVSATSTRFISLSDAVSVSEKIKLAKKYKLRGVIFFKFDGETDPALWKLF